MPKEDNPLLVEWIDSARPISEWVFLENKPAVRSHRVRVGWLGRW